MSTATQTQTEMILQYLEQGNTITPLEALEKFGCFRLGARIYDLRKEGYIIHSARVVTANKKVIAQYKLAA